MSIVTASSVSPTPFGTQRAKTFTPSVSSRREHRARLHADRLLDEFAERFTEEDFFPEGGDGLLFAMLTRLPQWPEDTSIVIEDGTGASVVSYLKGDDWEIVRHTITFVQHDDGGYSGPDNSQVYRSESLFQVLFSQIPSTSEIGLGSSDRSITNRIANLRFYISTRARLERARLFEALLADAHISKSELLDSAPNPFLPFWISTAEDRSLALWALRAQNPRLPIERLEDLLRTHPLTPAEENELLHDEMLPDGFAKSLKLSQAEWAHFRAIDGLLHTRVYDEQTNDLACTLAARLLTTRLGRDLVITQYADHKYQPPNPDSPPVSLVYSHDGLYGRGDQNLPWVMLSGNDTDSFFRAIAAQLRPHELIFLGLKSVSDIGGLRKALAKLAVDDNGGWFELDSAEKIRSLTPSWLKRISYADKTRWRVARRVYSRAVLDAQEAERSEIEVYGKPTQLRDYACRKLRERLLIDHGLMLEPDDVIVLTRSGLTGVVQSSIRGHIPSTHMYKLTDLSLSNVGYLDTEFRNTAKAVDAEGKAIGVLTASYLYDLIRDLNVGEDYANFLTSRLLSSDQGKSYAVHYARVMQAQMRLDALEAKFAGDYRPAGESPAGLEARAYHWVSAILDNPVDDGQRALVEGKRIQVEHLLINDVRLYGVLIIRPAAHFFGSPVVVYTAGAWNGRCFRLLNNLDELQPILRDPKLRDYFIGLAPTTSQAKIRNSLVSNYHIISTDTQVFTGNFLVADYEARVNRVIESVNQQTTTTSEKNWEAAWEIIRTAGEVGLMFTPFKITLPIAALRSLYALVQGVRSASDGDRKQAEAYFLEAAFLLLEMYPGPGGRRKLKPLQTAPDKPFIDRHTGVLNFDARPALSKVPDGLELRTDGFFNGVHERTSNGQSTFYVVRDGKAYPVEADHTNKVWRIIDLRNPNARDKTPVFPDSKNVWRYHPPGGAGGGVFKLDLTGLEQSKVFKKMDPHIEDRLLKSVETIKADFADNNKCHGFHAVEKVKAKPHPDPDVLTDPKQRERLFTFDIAGMPNDKGRGAWRLKVRELYYQKGVLVFEEIMPTHKSKR